MENEEIFLMGAFVRSGGRRVNLPNSWRILTMTFKDRVGEDAIVIDGNDRCSVQLRI